MTGHDHQSEPDVRRKLAESMRKLRDAQVERDDVVVELKQAAGARLEMLAKDLQPVFDEVPRDCDLFEFGMTNGQSPRLWIDITSHIRMGRDRQVYEFIKDTRLGRTVLAQSNDREKMAGIVTDYVAQRLLDRERTMEGDWLSLSQTPPADEKSGAHIQPGSINRNIRFFASLAWFLAGLAAGVLLLFAWAWFAAIPA